MSETSFPDHGHGPCSDCQDDLPEWKRPKWWRHPLIWWWTR